MRHKILIPALIAMMGTGTWAADDDDGAEATIRLMDTAEAALPGAVTRTITLPEHLLVENEDQVAAVDRAKSGHDKANQRLENEGRAKGLSQAEAARERGEQLADKAKEARENRSRADPPGRPDVPGRPEDPGSR
jgi:hypothetical protein